ncbi:hypothetical protein Pelo_8550 [Pelomyxa schiedti]|nr:hypothetical protein Pelo_8550 [Pelomyxa schiedti]
MRDRQGKVRGRCSQCDCADYVLPATGNACDYCGHYPTAHADSSAAAAVANPPAVASTSTTTHYQPQPQQQQQQYSTAASTHQQNKQLLRQYYANGQQQQPQATATPPPSSSRTAQYQQPQSGMALSPNPNTATTAPIYYYGSPSQASTPSAYSTYTPLAVVPRYEPPPQAKYNSPGAPPGPTSAPNMASPKLTVRDTFTPAVAAVAVRSKRSHKRGVLDTLVDLAKDKHE